MDVEAGLPSAGEAVEMSAIQSSTSSPRAAEGARFLAVEIVVPHGAAPGALLEIESTGRRARVRVPVGAEAGFTLRAQVPAGATAAPRRSNVVGPAGGAEPAAAAAAPEQPDSDQQYEDRAQAVRMGVVLAFASFVLHCSALSQFDDWDTVDALSAPYASSYSYNYANDPRFRGQMIDDKGKPVDGSKAISCSRIYDPQRACNAPLNLTGAAGGCCTSATRCFEHGDFCCNQQRLPQTCCTSRLCCIDSVDVRAASYTAGGVSARQPPTVPEVCDNLLSTAWVCFVVGWGCWLVGVLVILGRGGLLRFSRDTDGYLMAANSLLCYGILAALVLMVWHTPNHPNFSFLFALSIACNLMTCVGACVWRSRATEDEILAGSNASSTNNTSTTTLPTRALLRCGQCKRIFGIPPRTPYTAHVRCPYCDTLNMQPPTFGQKHAALQQRLSYRRRVLQHQRRTGTGNKLKVTVRRQHLLADSFRQLCTRRGDEWQSMPLSISFGGESGVDQGGVTREWLDCLSQEIVNPERPLFQCSSVNNYSYQINPNSSIEEHHLEYFNFVGKLLAKCVIDGNTVPIHFTTDIYNSLLQRPSQFSDLEAIDKELYRSLQWVLDNDPADLGMHFVVDVDSFGVIAQHELKPGGEDIEVTSENKKEFVELKAQHTRDRVSEQRESLAVGFASVLPLEEVRQFDPGELELLLCGVPILDVDEWQAQTEYRSGYTATHPAIVRFWEVVNAWDNDMRAKLLRFVTGTSKLPAGGFADLQGSEGLQRFAIIRVRWDEERLPQAATCFNQLMLPSYRNLDAMRDKLEIAVCETSGFELR